MIRSIKRINYSSTFRQHEIILIGKPENQAFNYPVASRTFLQMMTNVKIRHVFQTALFIFLLSSCFIIYQSSYYIYLQPEEPIIETEDMIRQRLNVSEEVWKSEVKSKQQLLESLGTKTDEDFNWDFYNTTFDCPHSIERLGKPGQGGGWICGFNHFKISEALPKNNTTCVVFSYAVNADSIVEDEILKRTNCVVYVFDPSTEEYNVPILEEYPGRTHFVDIGIGAAKEDEAVTPFKTAMKVYNVEFVDILKIDVFGYEYDVMRSILEEFPQGNLPIGQIVMEIHFGSSWKMSNHTAFHVWWNSLEAIGLRAFSKECHRGTAQPNCCCQVSFLNVKVDHRILHTLIGPS